MDIEAIKIRALGDVMEGDFYYHYRRICRWFSSRFHTPLDVVEKMPVEYVLQHFFEDNYENMTKAARRKEAVQLTETEEEKEKRIAKSNRQLSDEAFLKKATRDAKAKIKMQIAKKKEVDEQARKVVEEMNESDMIQAPSHFNVTSAQPQEPPPDLPEFSINF